MQKNKAMMVGFMIPMSLFLEIWCLEIYHKKTPFLGGGFKHFLFSPLFGEDSHFDEHIFQMGGSTTKQFLTFFFPTKKHFFHPEILGLAGTLINPELDGFVCLLNRKHSQVPWIFFCSTKTPKMWGKWWEVTS